MTVRVVGMLLAVLGAILFVCCVRPVFGGPDLCAYPWSKPDPGSPALDPCAMQLGGVRSSPLVAPRL